MRACTIVATALALALAGVVVATPAAASELIARNVSDVTLEVSPAGRALIGYRAQGERRRVLAWGAVDALQPTRDREQVGFRLDFAGGWGAHGRPVWRSFVDVCGPYRGPPLAWLVTACTAPDGSHWALQSWQRTLPVYGVEPTARQAAWELRLSHWTGGIAELRVRLNWAYGRFHHLFGTLTYRGRPVHGFRSTPAGEPLDTFGRNVYLDTFGSAYGRGWKRENGFLTHMGTGAFCYGLFPHEARPSGKGERYRATVSGPGVTPDVAWEAPAPGPFVRALDVVANDRIESLGDALCRPN
jgi:hypothetical protein